MTELLEQAFEAVRRLPADEQDDIARALLGIGEEPEPDAAGEHWAAVTEGLAQARRGEFSELTPREAVAAAFRRHER